MRLLGIDGKPESAQDEVLFFCFVVATGSYMLVRPPRVLDKAIVYALIHLPWPARMDFVMRQATNWSRHNRPNLVGWMTRGRFRILMDGAGEALRGMGSSAGWAEQTAFLLSKDGLDYFASLDKAFRALVDSL